MVICMENLKKDGGIKTFGIIGDMEIVYSLSCQKYLNKEYYFIACVEAVVQKITELNTAFMQ